MLKLIISENLTQYYPSERLLRLGEELQGSFTITLTLPSSPPPSCTKIDLIQTHQKHLMLELVLTFITEISIQFFLNKSAKVMTKRVVLYFSFDMNGQQMIIQAVHLMFFEEI